MPKLGRDLHVVIQSWTSRAELVIPLLGNSLSQEHSLWNRDSTTIFIEVTNTMSHHKAKARRSASQNHPHQQHQHSLSNSHLAVQPAADYDTDTYYPSDGAGQYGHHFHMQQYSQAHPGPPRTTADLNLSVLRSYNPSIASIVSIAPYAVLYIWSTDKGNWEKCNMEGTLFICALDHSDELPGYQRFVAIILNRRALGVFATLLEKSDDIEVNDEFVILRVHGDLGATGEPEAEENQGDEDKIYGLWIFSEADTSTADTRQHIAAVVQECASVAEKTRSAAEDALKLEEASREQREHDQGMRPHANAMGRQLSLTDLFSRQREADAGFSVHEHHSPAMAPAMPAISETAHHQAPQALPSTQQSNASKFQNTADTDFFRGASPYQASLQKQNGTGQGIGGVVGAGQNALLDLFKGANSGT